MATMRSTTCARSIKARASTAIEARRSQNLAYLCLGSTKVATRAVAWGSGAETIRYQHTDALGSPAAETNTGGTVTKRNTYALYGEVHGTTNIDGTGYTGHVMDRVTRLIYMQQRCYDPQIGRFLSVDPVVIDAKTDGSFNRYWYGTAVANNPITRESIVGNHGEVVEPHLGSIAKLDPDALVGFRGSLARGVTGPHKGNIPFNPENFDVDAFIVSDKLAGQFGSRVPFRSGARIGEVADVQTAIDSALRQNPAFGGLRQDPFTFRIFTQQEIARLQASADAQYFFIKPTKL